MIFEHAETQGSSDTMSHRLRICTTAFIVCRGTDHTALDGFSNHVLKSCGDRVAVVSSSGRMFKLSISYDCRSLLFKGIEIENLYYRVEQGCYIPSSSAMLQVARKDAAAVKGEEEM